MSNQAGLDLRAGAGRPARGASPRANGGPRRIAVNAAAFSHYFSKTMSGLGTLLFTAVVIAALYLGWTNRDEEYISADTGLGYWLGIVGSLMMLVLLLYPLRKSARFLRSLGKVPTWFRSHMFLGIVGPMLIVFHSNFHAHSLNAVRRAVLHADDRGERDHRAVSVRQDPYGPVRHQGARSRKCWATPIS